MSQAQQEPDPATVHNMTAAEFRIARERLGVPGDWLATQIGVTGRTVRRWEADRAPVPEGVEADLRAVEEETAAFVAAVVEALRDDEPDDDGARWVTTYASDAALVLEHPDSPWTAGWHRAAMGRVAQALPGVRVRYLGDPS